MTADGFLTVFLGAHALFLGVLLVRNLVARYLGGS